MTIYDRANNTAMGMLERFGRPWIFSHTDSGGAVTVKDAVGVFLETVRHTLGDSGVNIGDRKYIVTANASPQEGDRMKSGAEDYVVAFHDQIGDTPAAYYVWARAG